MILLLEQAVVVVGAGASVPFGAPDGLRLMDKIEETLKANERSLEKYARNSLFRKNLRDVSPIYLAWHNVPDTQQVDSHAAAAEFREMAAWLSKQTMDSIDDVIRHNPKYAERLKICIVYELLQVTHSRSSDGHYNLKELDNRLVDASNGKQRNWVHRLINVARSAMVEARQTKIPHNPKVKIVSFNYDGILEHVLDKKWNDVEGEFGDWSDVFDIYHPHGTIPISEQPIDRGQLVQYLREGASKIAVVHDEFVPKGIEEDRASAKNICKMATDIYALGFAFAPSNCRLLGWDKPLFVDIDSETEHFYPTIRHVHYLNYSGADGLRRRVEETFCPSDPFVYEEAEPDRAARVEFHPTEPSPEKVTVEITDALLNGFLGEMPA